jgi:hypothetical protein
MLERFFVGERFVNWWAVFGIPLTLSVAFDGVLVLGDYLNVINGVA